MSASHIHPHRSGFCVSDALDRIGEDIAAIRQDDKLTWTDVGRGMGKCKDRAQDYAKGLSEMPLSAFLLGCREWNGRFAGNVLAMIGMKLVPLDRQCDPMPDRKKASSIDKAKWAVSVMLEDEEISDEEIKENRQALIEGRDAFDALLARIGPKVARG